MRRQLQIRNGIAQSEWKGSGGMPTPPDNSWTFKDVTDRPEAQCGHLYDATTDTFTAPPPGPVVYSFYALIERFTAAERQALRALAATNATAADALEMLKTQGENGGIPNNDTKFLQRMQQLVTAGILTPVRRDAIVG